MRHRSSESDRAFGRAFEDCRVDETSFDHETHVRLAYTYLCEFAPRKAAERMKSGLKSFLEHLGVGEGKYHETMTRAWVDAVAHFMDSTDPCSSFRDFIDKNPNLLDSRIMLTHYSSELLFSDEARKGYVKPDLQPIPPD